MRFAVLDGWRGVCALLVALHHFHVSSHLFAVPLIRNGYLFVDFFFVLSGFVIMHAWGKRIRRPGDLGTFVGRRFARVWPLHAVVLAAFVALEALKAVAVARTGMIVDNAPFAGETSIPAIGTNLLLIHSLGIHDRATWNFPSWSISTEFYTYLLFGALSLLGLGRRPLAQVAVALTAALIVARFSSEWLHTIADYGYFRCVYGFFIGTAVYRLVIVRVGRRLPAAAALELAAVALVVALVSASAKGAPLSMAAPLVFGAAIAVFAFEAGPISRLLRLPLPQALGTWSYSIYLIHSLVLLLLGRVVSVVQRITGDVLTEPTVINGQTRVLLVFGDQWGGDAAVLAYGVVVVLLASVSWRWVERPGQRLFSPPRAD